MSQPDVVVCGDPSSSGASCCDCKSQQARRQQREDEVEEEMDNDRDLIIMSHDTMLTTNNTPWWPSSEDAEVKDRHNSTSKNKEDPWTYSGKRLQALEFPLGGFGTGQILVQGDGTFQGWTITNNFHDKEYSPLYKLPGSLFGIQTTTTTTTTNNNVGGTPQQQQQYSFVLQTPQNYTVENRRKHFSEESHVTPAQVRRMQELPGIPSLTAKCQYPIATLQYDMPDEFPVQVQLECMTPLIPGNTKDSSLPMAVFTFTVHNPSDTDSVDVSLLQSTLNLVGWDGKSSVGESTNTEFWQSNVNTPIYYPRKESSCCGSSGGGGGYAGWSMTSQNTSLEASREGSLALVAVQPASPKGGCCDTDDDDSTTWRPGLLVADQKSEVFLWQRFCQGKIQDPATYTTPTDPSPRGHTYIGGVTQSLTIPPQSTRTCQFLLTWYFPNRPSYSDRPHLPSPILGNYYQNWYGSAQDVVGDVVPRLDSLLETTRKYVEILYSTTIPWELLESAAGRVSVLRSPSMFWTQQGIVLGNEGNQCCPLNCTHVYGYSILMERLYPDLAKNMLHSNFILNFDAQEGCSMRFGTAGFAIDGSLACVIKVYLVVKQADSKLEFLAQVWPNVKRQMEIVLAHFVQDDDEDCVIRGEQKNTYDTAMQGANTFIGTYWITALRVTSIMAELMGDSEFASQCQQNSVKAAKAYEQICWKEDFQYYIADVDETNCAHSYGTGCFIDQLCAVALSLAAGLGTVLDPEHEAAARQSIFQQNQVAKPPFEDFQKHFYNGDEGVRVNTYPHGKLPGCYVYDDLVSTGFSYPVIAAMIYEGNTEMALAWARKIRNRHSGVNRSPWNEPECGLLYVRAMAAWGLYDQACGFNYDSTMGTLSYDPKFCQDKFSCLLVVEDGWGQYRQEWDEKTTTGRIYVECHYGSIRLKRLASSSSTQILHSKDTSGGSRRISVTLGKNVVPVKCFPGSIQFATEVIIPAGSTLIIDVCQSLPSKMNGGNKLIIPAEMAPPRAGASLPVLFLRFLGAAILGAVLLIPFLAPRQHSSSLAQMMG